MENSTIEIEVLKAQLKELEKENDYLKTLLRDAGIDYAPAFQSEGAEIISAFVPNQGSRIVPVEITRNHANFNDFEGCALNSVTRPMTTETRSNGCCSLSLFAKNISHF